MGSKSQIEEKSDDSADDGKRRRPRNVGVAMSARRNSTQAGQRCSSLVRCIDDELDDACDAAEGNGRPEDHPSPNLRSERDGKSSVSSRNKRFVSLARDDNLSGTPCLESVQKGEGPHGENRCDQEKELEDSQNHA